MCIRVLEKDTRNNSLFIYQDISLMVMFDFQPRWTYRPTGSSIMKRDFLPVEYLHVCEAVCNVKNITMFHVPHRLDPRSVHSNTFLAKYCNSFVFIQKSHCVKII